LQRRKNGKYWLVQLATRAKRRIDELIQDYPLHMNGMSTKSYLNIIPLGSYDCLIGMDWLDKHHVVVDCYNKAFTCLNEEGNIRSIQGNPRAVTVREISSRQLKRSIWKGY
jgi:hypothetical protein